MFTKPTILKFQVLSHSKAILLCEYNDALWLEVKAAMFAGERVFIGRVFIDASSFDLWPDPSLVLQAHASVRNGEVCLELVVQRVEIPTIQGGSDP